MANGLRSQAVGVSMYSAAIAQAVSMVTISITLIANNILSQRWYDRRIVVELLYMGVFSRSDGPLSMA